MLRRFAIATALALASALLACGSTTSESAGQPNAPAAENDDGGDDGGAVVATSPQTDADADREETDSPSATATSEVTKTSSETSSETSSRSTADRATRPAASDAGSGPESSESGSDPASSESGSGPASSESGSESASGESGSSPASSESGSGSVDDVSPHDARDDTAEIDLDKWTEGGGEPHEETFEDSDGDGDATSDGEPELPPAPEMAPPSPREVRELAGEHEHPHRQSGIGGLDTGGRTAVDGVPETLASRAQLTLHPPYVQGPCEPLAVAAEIEKKKSAYRTCYVEHLSRTERPTGEFELGFYINADGTVDGDMWLEHDQFQHDPIEECISGTLDTLRFAPPTTGVCEVNQTFVLELAAPNRAR